MRLDLLSVAQPPWRFGLLAACAYLLLGGLWIFASDHLLLVLIDDEGWRGTLQTAKGLLFVLVNASLLGGLAAVVLRQHQALRVRLVRQEADYRTLFRESPFPLFAEDASSGELLAVNDAACELYGHDYGEWLSLRFAGLQAGAGRSGEALIHRRRDGSPVEVEVHTRPIRFSGRRALLHHVRDLTAQRAAESALAASEVRLRLCVRATGLGVWDYHPGADGEDAVLVSPEYATMLGQDPQTFTESAQAWFARMHPEDRERVRTHFRRYLNGEEESYRVEFRMAHRDGGYRWIRSVGQVVERDAAGRPLRLIGSHLDITNEVCAAERIRSLTRLYEALSHTSQAIVHARDAEELFVRVCAIAVEQGRVRLAWIARCAEGGLEVLASCAQDGVESGAAGCSRRVDADALARLRQRGEVVIGPCIGPAGMNARALLPLREGGETVAVMCLCAERADFFSGEMVGVLAEMAVELSFALDRFALQQARADMEARLRDSEARFRLYLERLPIGCMVTDLDMRIREANPTLAAIFGFSRQQLDGCNAFETIISEAAAPQFRLMLSRLRDGALDAHGITAHRTQDGREIVCEWFNTPLRGASGQVEAGLFMVMDVSERVADQARLAETHRELADLSARLIAVQEEERRSLARELHDEVGQQLAALRLNLAVLRSHELAEGDGARVADCLAIVEYTLRRIRDRALNLRPAILDDLGLGPALQWYCRTQGERSGVPIHLELPPPRRYGEALEITAFRIVQEAVRNALQHGAPTQVRVGLSELEGNLLLRIDDDGRGMDAGGALQGRLGLVGMRERAALAGGHLQVESLPRLGTRVRAALPLPPDKSEPQGEGDAHPAC